MTRVSPLLVAIALAFGAVVPSFGATYYLSPDGSGDFPTIQAAFDAAEPLDVIVLLPGVYREHDIEAAPWVSIRGEGGPEQVVLDASGGQWGIYSDAFAAPRTVDGITFRGAAITALLLEGGGTARIADCVVYDCGVGMYLRDMYGVVIRCTLVGGHLSTGTSGSGLSLSGGSPVVRNCLIAFNQGCGVVEWGQGNPSFHCNDVYGNGDGDYCGVEDATGSDENVSEEPQFCNRLNDDYSLAATSICAPENSPCGEQIGGLGVGCATGPEGACCNEETGQCLFTSANICALGGDVYTFHPGEDCEPNPCPQPVGACCLRDGSCVLANDSECELLEGHFRGYDVPCDPSPCSITDLDAAGIEPRLALSPPRPNPMRGRTELDFVLSAPARVRVDVYDVSGRSVARILDGDRGPGLHRAEWNGLGEGGDPVASGVYRIRLITPDGASDRSVLVVR